MKTAKLARQGGQIADLHRLYAFTDDCFWKNHRFCSCVLELGRETLNLCRLSLLLHHGPWHSFALSRGRPPL
jgi:hypothetical protein